MQLNQRSQLMLTSFVSVSSFLFSLFHSPQLLVRFPLMCCSCRHAATFKCNFLLIQLKHVLRQAVTVGRVTGTELQLTAAHWVGRRLSDLSLSPPLSLSLSALYPCLARYKFTSDAAFTWDPHNGRSFAPSPWKLQENLLHISHRLRTIAYVCEDQESQRKT